MKKLLKKWSQQRLVGGYFNTINVVILLLMATFNLVSAVFIKTNIITSILYTSPFIASALILFMFNKKEVTASLFFICGVFASALARDVADFSGAILFIFSFHLMQTKSSSVLIIISTLISLSVRYVLITASIPQALMVIVAYFYMYTFYYIVIYDHPTQLKELNKYDQDILTLFAKGYSCSEINKELKLNIEARSVRQHITQLRKKYNCSNDYQFAIKLTQMR